MNVAIILTLTALTASVTLAEDFADTMGPVGIPAFSASMGSLPSLVPDEPAPEPEPDTSTWLDAWFPGST